MIMIVSEPYVALVCQTTVAFGNVERPISLTTFLDFPFAPSALKLHRKCSIDSPSSAGFLSFRRCKTTFLNRPAACSTAFWISASFNVVLC